MKILIDADACPVDVKELLYRAAERRKISIVLVANQPVRLPASSFLSSVCVSGGMNMADRKIVELTEPGDLTITADIPLAAHVVEKGGQALNPRGELYTEDNIGECVAARNLNDELRGNGLISGGPAAYGSKDLQRFANQFDRWLARAR